MNESIVFTSATYINSKQDVIEVVVDGVTMHVPKQRPRQPPLRRNHATGRRRYFDHH
jgi:hypothetical protein